ncbi:hypothetical protein [Candidatus Nitrosocosmicus arcticus]|uniref:Uncharacterized protein n=1 Tax=Candidatus Nitrosocosmicus arcticus TaxID=2035267 RepID=A0A557SU94_9ARCH|nr:hypothetical protein [Candidatus Nitrosocosmicus arcticus]TVP40184.1 hypothetical protein NARC_90090 [Candidatus Nitrosocosmicus arcticus]
MVTYKLRILPEYKLMTRNVSLSCKRCGNLWLYTGTNNYVTSCSKCKTSVSIRKNQVVGELDANAVQTSTSSRLILKDGGQV